MKKFCAFFLVTALLGAADLTIDHVTIAGTDLKQMQARLASVGITSEFGGAHSNGATQMALTSFPDGSYLELMALVAHPDQKAVDAHYWSKELLGNAGPTAWAVRALNVAAEVKRLEGVGIVVSQPMRSGRTRPDGVKLEWETARVGEEPNGTFFPFLIRDLTPRKERAYPKGVPTTQDFTGVRLVVIVVHNLKESAARFEKAYGLDKPLEQDDLHFGARLAAFEGTPVVLAAPLHAHGWLTERLKKFGEGPCAFVLGYQETGTLKAVASTRWFGTSISWLDPKKLGWWLGFEE